MKSPSGTLNGPRKHAGRELKQGSREPCGAEKVDEPLEPGGGPRGGLFVWRRTLVQTGQDAEGVVRGRRAAGLHSFEEWGTWSALFRGVGYGVRGRCLTLGGRGKLGEGTEGPDPRRRKV